MEADEEMEDNFADDLPVDENYEAEKPAKEEPARKEPASEEDSTVEEEYLGPYFEEMRLLRGMIDGWAGKEILIMGAGRTPDDFSIPVILARLGANVYAVDVNYRGPAEYQGCKYFRISADRINGMFAEGQFDIVISTAMFGVPFTNWAIRQYRLNSFDGRLAHNIKKLELEVIGKLLWLTKAGGIHFHHNRDLNPQSWTFSEYELKQIGCETAFHPEELLSSRGTWFLRK